MSTRAKRYLQLDAHIGQGTYGKVEKAEDSTDGKVVAIKKVKVEAVTDKLADGDAVISMYGIHYTVLREIKLMSEIHHKYVMDLKDVFVDKDFVNLVMPHMASDLRKVLEKRVRFNEANIKCILQMILEGMKILHDNYFLHRDLSPANVFIAADGTCKVADFGLCRMYGSPRPCKKTPKVVTLWYRSPELLFGAPYYQDKIDTWSIGCIFAELLNGGKPLFPGLTEVDQLAKIFAITGTPVVPQEQEEEEGSQKDLYWPECKNLPLYVDFTHCDPVPLKRIFPTVSHMVGTAFSRLTSQSTYYQSC
ncbi:MAG: uncharacterized protein KVP18_003019 [Porospora cf. gigantea A]|uniref:uncharacterized protein n=1 Tax=Porospora cf. gigantea A TaxID=2853593 RepID=UPI003559CAC1|nr:MAG: hypothetical protein KVP18_003019 [Porospora cf. gigantea A]